MQRTKPMDADAEKPLVLVIDDERGPRDSLRMLVKGEFELVSADHVDGGVELLKQNQPDVIVMDIRMPGKTGIEGLSEIRAIDPIVSVIMLTGYGALDTARQALQLGANDYMQKPFDTVEMLQNLRKHVQRTRLARRREASLERLHALNVELHESLATQERLASLGKKSAEFAHDLCSPLNVVMAYTEMLSEHLDESRGRLGDGYERMRDNMESIEMGVSHCRDLMKEWRRASHGDGFQIEGFPVTTLLDRVRETVEPLASATNIQFECRAPSATGVTLEGSLPQLMRALNNLLINAIQAVTPVSGRVRLEAITSDDQLVVRVSDNGGGMTEEQLQHVFEPGFTTKDADRGTGLGVPIARSVVEAHGGELRYDSQVGRGTRAIILLPLRQPEATAT